MANWITLLRIVLLFVGIGFIYSYTVTGELIAFGMILVVVLLDWLDGVVARREGRADETGAVMDILGDRIVENVLWIVFAHIGLIPVWVPLVVIVRGLATDAVRSVALARGETALSEDQALPVRARGLGAAEDPSSPHPHGPPNAISGWTMMRSRIGRGLVASRTSRALYAAVKVVTFGYLILYMALIRAQSQGIELGAVEGWLPEAYNLGMGLVDFTVALCVVRGAPVLVEGWRYVRRG